MLPATGQIIFTQPIRQNHLLRASSLFPFTLLPNELILKDNQLVVITRKLFSPTTTQFIPISRIKRLNLETNSWFSTLKIYTSILPEESIEVTYLSNKDALSIKRTVEEIIKQNL